MLLSWRTVTNGKEHVKLDDETDFTLLNSIAVLIDRNRGGNYFESDIQRAIKSTKLKSPGQKEGEINHFKSVTIRAEDATRESAGECSKYGYKLFKHELYSMTYSSGSVRVDLIAGIRLLIPCSNKGGEQYNEVKLCKDQSTIDTQGGTGDHYLYHSSTKYNVYVYFYGKDPRPLLLCYNSNAYRPSSTSEYDSKWVNDKNIKKCGCESRGGDQLLTTLTQVVGVLNTVHLEKRPGKCNGTSTEVAMNGKCDSTNGTNGNTCTYTVHTYTGRSIKVKVTCKTVTKNGGSSSPQNGHLNGENGESQSSTPCTENGYKTVTHEPVGFNGGSGTGFRLGDVEYKGTGTKGTLSYYTGPSKHKYNPVKKVTGYYLGDDFEKPLVVVLVFEKSQPPSPPSTSKEYYKLTKTGEEMEWSSDKEVERKIGDCNELVKHLQTIKFILNKKIYVILNEHGKYEKDKLNDITDSSKKKIEVSKYQPDQIDVSGENVTGPEPPESKPPYKKYTHDIKVDLESSELQNFPDDARRDVTLELVPSIPKVMIPMYEGSVGGKNAKLTFKQNGQGTSLSTQLVVYFYNHPSGGGGTSGNQVDKVPLMLEHNDEFYGPKDRDSYFTGWNRISGIKEAGDTQNIKTQLDRVNKLLNEINISHDTSVGLSYGISTAGSEAQLTKDFRTESVRVACEKVGDGGSAGGVGGVGACSPTSPGSNGCTPSPYIKYIHTTVNKFQLGAIKYKGQDVKVVGDGRNGGKPITVNSGQNLLEVYYLTADSKYTYPLLIGIGQQGAGADTYYRLKTTGERPGTASGYMWQQDRGARSKVGRPTELVKHLDKINYEVKKVLKIELQQNSGQKYQAMGRAGTPGTGPFDQQIGTGKDTTGKEITVEECTKTQCTALNSYKCYRHKITSLGTDDLNQVGGIALTLPGVGRDKVVEIPLFNDGNGTCENGNGEPMNQLFYNKCMGDVYVFFYHGSTTDTVPLMLLYGGMYYKPNSRKEYFSKWVCVNAIVGGPPCGSDGGTTLAGKLDEVNKSLNVIELDKSGTGKGYGLPPSTPSGQVDTGQFSTERVKVTELKPKSPYANQAYTRVVHRTKNGFQIGEIKYGQEITEHGINAGMSAHITVNGGSNHSKSVTGNGWNTVVAYYSGTDTQKKLPQLIVILKTDSEISGPVKTSKHYGYYILSTKNGGQYEYVWRTDTGGVTLNDATDFTLLNSVVILLEWQKNGDGNGYGDREISTAIKTAIEQQGSIASPGQSGDDVNRITGKRITVKDASGSSTECSNYGYKVYQHDFSKMVERGQQLKNPALKDIDLILGVRLLIPAMENGGTENNGQTKYKQLELSGGAGDGAGLQTHYLYFTGSQDKVYVYFYQGLDDDEGQEERTSDQRPILLCYNSKAYKPKSCSEYDTKWVNASTIRQCGSDRGSGDKLLPVLTEVVGFLNKVELQKRPGGGDCNGATEGATTCPGSNGESSNGASCTYEVHTYQGKPIKVKVECKAIRGTDEATSTEGCFYWEFKHTPNGMNGGSGASTNGAQPAKGFRLGQVKYESSVSGTVTYTGGTNKYHPLISVTTYYYSEDIGFTKPLLVVLEFKKSPSPSPNGTTATEYYKLKSSDSMSLSWTDDTVNAKKKLGVTEGRTDGRDNNKLVLYLDSIRFENMKVVQIMISSMSQYDFKTQDGTARDNRFSAPNGDGGGKQIKVTECTGCTALVSKGYKCFVHKLKTAVESGRLEDKVGGIKLTIPGKPQGNDVEIPLHRKKPGTESDGSDGGGSDPYSKIDPLTYNKCMGDIYVYFYNKGGGTSGTETDKIPLMLVYNNKFYKPQDRDQYFDKWIPVQGLGGVKPVEGCGDDNGAKLVTQLDIVNRELNRIDLDKARGPSYGLPSTGQGGAKPHPTSFPTERVIVTPKEPTDPNASKTYTRVVHRTKNGFTVGALTSKGGKNDITSAGFQVTGGPVISVKNGARNGDNNHTVYTNLHKLNTVVVYYSNTDKDKKLPQLMVLLHTGEAIKPDGGSEGGGDTPIKASQTQYGYYIIAIKQGDGDGDGQYEYKWVEVNGKPDSTPAKQLVLNDETDFSLLNSVVILLEQRGTSTGGTSSYGDKQIKRAVKTASISSPGNSEDVNRITKKDITLSVEGATTLSDTGFKCWTHDISALVNLNGSLKSALSSVNLIGGLRFLIPTRDEDSYRQLTLNGGEPGSTSGGGEGLIMYHQPGRGVDNNKVCVFFYQGEASGGGSQSNQGDPRPLLMCYVNQGYKPKDLKCYFEEWYKDSTVSSCKCDKSGEGTKLLEALVKVSNFLNPVKLEKVPTTLKNWSFYCVHKFNGKHISIELKAVLSKDKFCYHKYTHTHYGTGSGGTGFRLGNIMYGKECIKETNGATSKNGASSNPCITASHDGHPYKPSPEVVTYYYKGDKGHKNPLLVALKQANGFYEYKPFYELQRPEPGGATDKKYKKQTGPIDLSNTKKLGEKLDKILYEISQKLQVILDQRPLPQWYSTTKQDSTVCKGEHEDLQSLRNKKQEFLKSIEEQYKKDKKPRPDYFFYHVPLKTCYEAQLYDNQDKPVSNGTTHYNIGVEEMKCAALTSRGYRCFKHDLLAVKGIEEVGGLRLYLYGDKELELHNYTENDILDPELLYCEQIVPVTYNTCKGNLYVYFYSEDPRPLMLCYDGKGYNDSKLECVHVYYNQYENKTPLLFVLQFQGVSGKNKYYKRSEFQPELAKGGSKSINKLESYYSDTGILTTLNNENDKLTNFLTFNITKNGDDSGNTYNDKKIKLFKYYYFINFIFYLKNILAYR